MELTHFNDYQFPQVDSGSPTALLNMWANAALHDLTEIPSDSSVFKTAYFSNRNLALIPSPE
ncbi:hypothetical protein ACTXT7_008247 [Hymenolepis weldensis]